MGDSTDGIPAPASFKVDAGLRWGGSVPVQPALPLIGEVPSALGSLPSLAKALETVPEHRRPRGFKAHQPPYPLVPMLLLLLVGLLCGRRGYGSIAEWAVTCGRECPAVLEALGFPVGRQPRTPVASTLFRLVRDLDGRAFQAALQGWLVEVAAAWHLALPAAERPAVPADQISLDGKTVRGAAAWRGEQGGLHLLAAYVPALQVVLDQVDCGGKGHELAAAQVVLGQLPLEGCVYTADAQFTQREFCQTILDGGGDYLVPVKENQPALLADLEAALSPPAAAAGGAALAAGPAGGAGSAAPPDAARRRLAHGPGALRQSAPRAG